MTGPSLTGGRMVAGRYRLQEPVGRGGMGTVWRAHDDLLGRTVAVKEVDLPHVGEIDRTALRERTMREARAAARLSHPNAVTVYDVIEDGGEPWIIMALVPAQSLAEVLRESGPLKPRRVAQIGLDVLSALQAAHAAGILHRDVKPGNVLLGDDGRVVLTDFGIATLEGDSSLTSTGLLMGAPAYIAPERARGLKAGPASDLWSLGATLYAAVEGRPPYDRETPMATLTALISEDPPEPRAAGPLAPVLMGLLDRDPQRRTDAPTARRMLEAALAGAAAQPTKALPVPAPEPAVGSRQQAASTQVIAVPPRPVEPPPVRVARTATVLDRPRPSVGGRRAALLGPLALAIVGAALLGIYLARGRGPAAKTPATKVGASASPHASQRPSPSPSGAPSTAPSPSSAASTRPSPSTAASPSTAVSSPSSPVSVGGAAPAGFVRYHDPAGFSVAVPAGWQPTRNRGFQIDFQDPATGRFLRIGHTSLPPADPVADWKRQEQTARARLPGYQRISIQPVSYRGYSAADWNFTFGSGTGRTEVLDRGFSPDPRHGYAIYLSAPQSQWAASLPYFETAARSFQLG